MNQFTKEYLSQLWGISLNTAAQTLQVTTQKGIRNAIHPIVRRYATKQSRLRYNQLGSKHGKFYSDTFFATTKSTRGNTMAQLYVNDAKYMRIMPMRRKADAHHTLQELIQDIGIPAAIHCDGAKELQLGKWRDTCNDYGIKLTSTEPYSPWQNRAEVNIREAKKKSIHRLMTKTKTPKVLWDYCASYVAEIISLTANDLYAVNGRTPHELVTGNTPDISEWSEFAWYEPIYHYEDVPFPQTKRKIARWLGVAHRVGQALCYWILSNTGQVLARTSIQKLTDDELKSPLVLDETSQFDSMIKQKLGESMDIKDDNPNAYLQDIYDDEEVVEPFDVDATQLEEDVYPIKTPMTNISQHKCYYREGTTLRKVRSCVVNVTRKVILSARLTQIPY